MTTLYPVDEHYENLSGDKWLPDVARCMYAALDKIAHFPDFPPSSWPASTDPEHMWNEMVMIARRCLSAVDVTLHD
jgi:hypothetical protein